MNKMKIGNLFTLEKGSLQSSKCTEGNYDFITAAKEWKTHNKYSHEAEALIFAAMASGSLGRTHYVNGKFITSDLCYILSPKDSKKYPIDLKFYHFVFNSLRDEIVKNTKSGTSKEAINQTNLKNYEIPYFDIKQQQLWIEKLLNTKVIKENLITEIQTQQTLLKKLRQSILQEAIEGKLTTDWRASYPDVEPASALLEKIRAEKEQLVKEKKIRKQKPLPPIEEGEVPFEIPESWEWCYFGNIASIQSNLVNPEEYQDYIQVGPDSIEKNTGKLLKIRTVKDSGIFSSNHLFYKNQLIYSKVRPKLNKIIVAEFNGLCSADMYPIKSYIINKYLQQVMLSEFFYWEIDKFDNRVKMPKLNQNQLNLTRIPLPPFKEQKEIVKKIENLFTLCDALEAQIDQSKTNIEALMQSVLREAFEPEQPMEKIGDDEKAMTAMSCIIDNIEPEKLGRVKLQKIFYMYSVANNEYFGFNYKNKHAMGPHDKVRMDEIEAKLQQAGWFQKRIGEGEKGRIDYIPLSNKNSYKKLLSQLPNKKGLDHIIDLMRPLDLARSEVIATLYAVWKEERSLLGTVEDTILIGKAKEWHQNKMKYTNDHWKWGMKWLRDNGFVG